MEMSHNGTKTRLRMANCIHFLIRRVIQKQYCNKIKNYPSLKRIDPTEVSFGGIMENVHFVT